ncbi:MAG TPA: hypothetical protein DCP06_01345 [Lachnospiraceae bacterium]|nr:hypothetical protein [Lachnospiraceae bacterium]
MSENKTIPDNNIYIWMIKHIAAHKLTIHAGHVTFFMLVSALPFVMLILKIAANIAIVDEQQLVDILEKLSVGPFKELLHDWIKGILDSNGNLVVFLTIVGLLWAGSKGFDGIAQALDNIYMTSKRRNFVVRRLYSVVYLLGFIILIMTTLILLVFGRTILDWLTDNMSFLSHLDSFLNILRYAVAIVSLMAFFTLLFRFVPYTPSETGDEKLARKHMNSELPRGHKKKKPHSRLLKTELPGAILTTVLWFSFSSLYSIYVRYQITNGSSIYGSLTAFFLSLLWLYYLMIFMFFGGLFNNYTYRTGEPHLKHLIRDIPGLIRWIFAKLNSNS